MGAKERILLVEDYGPIAEAIKNILEMNGYRVSTASDGVEALELMESLDPDLIVADILMPEMDGYAFLEEVQKNSEWCSVPFIFLTSMAEREDVQKGRDLGAARYITKPFEPEDLLEAARAELDAARPEE